MFLALVAAAGALLAALLLELVARRRRALLVARAAHELRGPLTAAAMALHAARRAPRADAERHGDALDAVERQLLRAGLAVDDVARAARGRRPEMRWAPVDVAALVGEGAAAFRPALRAAGRELVAGLPPRVTLEGDARLLGQALANLLANALDHGSGTVVLSARRRGGRLRLEVRDGGRAAGPPPAPRSIARRLRAAAALTRGGGPGRRGHGLRVAADVAARHGGRLLLLRDERGTAAVIELPLAGTAAGGRRRQRRRRPSAAAVAGRRQPA